MFDKNNIFHPFHFFFFLKRWKKIKLRTFSHAMKELLAWAIEEFTFTFIDLEKSKVAKMYTIVT